MARFLKISLILLLCLIAHLGRATHNRAGEITYRQVGPLTIEMTITTYTKNSSSAADRDSLEVAWGDGTMQQVKRDNSRTRIEANDIKVNFYVASHTYPGASTYTVSFQDPNRIGNILNINYPNSIDIPFFLSTTFTLLDPQFQGFNNSAILLQSPIDIGCVNKVFVHNPNAFDIDGDSLAYELGVPLEAVNTPVPLYKLPDEIGDPSNNSLTIDPITGELRWNSPKLQGEYNIAIRIKEYRKGKLINVILRDMQVLIRACENDPPTIIGKDKICVIAGTKVSIELNIDDPNLNQKVKIGATGGPFTFAQKAVLNAPKFFTKPAFKATLEWQTSCDHINDEYYKVVIRAADNFYNDSTGLATLKTILIKVVAPAPQNLIALSENNAIRLKWTNPYACEESKDIVFQGFSIWRKTSSAGYIQDTCSPGLTGKAYTKIVFKTKDKVGDTYTYLDKTAQPGITYCYRIQAEFARLTSSGNPYNFVEGMASDEICIVPNRDLPMITKVSVTNTDISNGKIDVRWTKPLPNQLDTIKHPGPYQYNVLRQDGSGFKLIETINSPFWGSTIDTSFMDDGINTLATPFTYKIGFVVNGVPFGESQTASSIFLSISPTDRKNNLSWTSSTPWFNSEYNVFRLNNQGIFESIGTTNQPKFTDENLDNSLTYCYRIESKGSYNIPNIEEPIFNFSQQACKMPIDDVPPCIPNIRVINICDQLTGSSTEDDLFNTITWDDITQQCPTLSADLAGYNIYYATTKNDSLTKIATIDAQNQLRYFHFPPLGLLGCYAITSVDLNGNESAFSEKICVDNCPFYELPNTFTPNGDGYNDMFKPTINRFVASVDFQVFNAWGNLVFSTSDPALLWDGRYKNDLLPDGTYHYVCDVFENRVTGVVKTETPISGYILLLKN